MDQSSTRPFVPFLSARGLQICGALAMVLGLIGMLLGIAWGDFFVLGSLTMLVGGIAILRATFLSWRAEGRIVVRALRVLGGIIGGAFAALALGMLGLILYFSEREFPPDAADALAQPDHVVLYSIAGGFARVGHALQETDSEEAAVDKARADDEAAGRSLDHFPVLGHADLDTAQATGAADAMRAAVYHWSVPGETLCFNPHHALRVTSQGHLFDFIICYECGSVEVYRDGARLAKRQVEGSPKVFDDLLVTTGLPRSPS